MSESPSGMTAIVTDFYIDFFGSLLPGIYAVIPSVAAVAMSASAFLYSIPLVVAGGRQSGADLSGIGPSLLQWKDTGLGTAGNVGLLLVVCYVVGSVFFRRDPKRPDHVSARRIWRDRNLSGHDRARLAVQPTRVGSDDISEYDTQFPYFYLREYLDGRGLDRLAKWVPWSGCDKDTWGNRSKMFINILKIRLQFLVPERCKEIVRNEAHVRMATSLWYASRWLIFSGGGSLLMAALAGMLAGGPSRPLLGILGLDVAILAIALFMKVQIQRSIHYMRVREIVYVLETADFALRNGSALHPEDFMTLP
jgi:hypothetical protein